MAWQDQLRGDSLAWLLAPDDPGVRYLALRDLLDRPADDPSWSQPGRRRMSAARSRPC